MSNTITLYSYEKKSAFRVPEKKGSLQGIGLKARNENIKGVMVCFRHLRIENKGLSSCPHFSCDQSSICS